MNGLIVLLPQPNDYYTYNPVSYVKNNKIILLRNHTPAFQEDCSKTTFLMENAGKKSYTVYNIHNTLVYINFEDH
jgi:hypothetical protein